MFIDNKQEHSLYSKVNMTLPLVSILIPVYNVDQYLTQCLDSVIGQTYHELQIVLIDDGSKDGSLAICQEYAAKDSRIEVYHQDNQGVATTRNNLLDKVKGDYVLFVDADDWIEHVMVEFLVNKLTVHNADVAMCGMVVNNTLVKAEYTESLLSKEDCIKTFLFHKELKGSLWNKLVKTSLIHNARFHGGISYGEDALFCWHFLQSAQQILMTNRQLYHYRMNDESLSHEGFGPKKFTAYQVWTTICKETAEKYPQFVDIAKGHFCFSMLVLYKNALHSGYPKDEIIQTLARVVNKYREKMRAKKCANLKWYLYSWIVCLPYNMLKKK